MQFAKCVCYIICSVAFDICWLSSAVNQTVDSSTFSDLFKFLKSYSLHQNLKIPNCIIKWKDIIFMAELSIKGPACFHGGRTWVLANLFDWISMLWYSSLTNYCFLNFDFYQRPPYYSTHMKNMYMCIIITYIHLRVFVVVIVC